MTDDRDPKLQSAYRSLGAEEPPRALDEAVLAASRRAVKVRPAPLVAPTGRRSWSVPLAAAAVLALAVGVTLHMQVEQPGIEGPGSPPAAEHGRRESVAKSSQPPAAEPARVASAPPAATGEMVAKRAPDNAVASRAKEKTAQAAETGPGAPPEKEQRAHEELAKSSAERSLASAREAAPAAASAAPQSAVAPALAKRADAAAQAAADTPERELERIADLRKQGRHDEADKALAEFRKRHPDFKIPAAMLERVERR